MAARTYKRTLITGAMLLASASTLSAQSAAFSAPPPTARALTLDEAMQLALDRNLNIEVQRITPQTFDLSLASLRAVYRPTLTSQVGTQATVTPSTSTISGASAAAGITAGLSTLNAGITSSLPWGGGGYTVTLNNNRQTTTSQTTLFNPAYNTNYSFQYTQPLMRGLFTDSTRQQIAITKLNQEMSELQLEATIVNTLSDVRNAYWDFVYATEAVGVARQSLDLANRLVADNESRVQVGTLAPIDVLQARSQAATQQKALVQAQAVRDRAELNVKTLIVSGPSDLNWNETLDPIDRPSFSPKPIDIAAAVRSALASRTDLASAKKSLQASNVTLKYLKNQLLPEMNLVARYGLIGLGGTQYQRSGSGITGDIVNTVPGGYGDAIGSLFSANYPTWSAAVNITIPLGQSAASASAARADLQLRQADSQMRQIELKIAADVTNAARGAQSAVQSVEAARLARDLAEQTLDGEERRYQVGMSTNFNVIQAQRDVAAARNGELEAVLAYRKALVELDRLQQTTLQSSNVTVVSGG